MPFAAKQDTKGKPYSILPGGTIGILGSGQLGRMLALEARAMGYRVHVLSPGSDTPTGQVADREFSADYLDLDAVREFASSVDVVTYEFENVPAATAATCAEVAPLRPGVQALHVAQNRQREKAFVEAQGGPVVPHVALDGPTELGPWLERLGGERWVLKSAESGYDGKGQYTVASADQSADAWQAVGNRPAVLERFLDLRREFSVVAARGIDGHVVAYDLFENDHRRHILDETRAPAAPYPAAEQPFAIVRAIMDALGYVGVLCVEFFETKDGALYVNEMAPRPHNSGHLTLDACVTSQFEQQLRAICGLPLGAADFLAPACMVNLLGDLWHAGAPDWTAVLDDPRVKLHLYGKKAPRPGRKMGHLTVTAKSVAEACWLARAARQRIAFESSESS